MYRPFAISAYTLGIVALLTVSREMAGRFRTIEHTVAELGRGFSGNGVTGSDVSAIFHSPASLTLTESQKLQFVYGFVDE